MEKYSLSEALKLNVNQYDRNRLETAEQENKHINQFYPCHTFCKVEKHDERYIVENIKHYLDNDVCKITIIYDKYKKKYRIWFEEKFNIPYYKIETIIKSFKAPKNIGVLSTKKIQEWISYVQNIYLAIKSLNEQNSEKINKFLETIKSEDVIWIENNKQGKIVKNGLVYTFSIIDGYIYENIEIHYSIPKNFETFKMLSENKLKIHQ